MRGRRKEKREQRRNDRQTKKDLRRSNKQAKIDNRQNRKQQKQDRKNQKQDRKDRRLELKSERNTGKTKRAEIRANKSMTNTAARTEMNAIRAEHGMGTPAEEIAKTLGKAALDTVGAGFGDFMDFKTVQTRTMAGDKKNMLEVIGVNDNNGDGRTNVTDLFAKKPTKDEPTEGKGVMAWFKKKPVAAIGVIVGIPVAGWMLFKSMFLGKKKRR